jgi:lipopolysaccharide/colanic/teichoic acid biosynthesis glycosyltransferase
MEVNRMQPVRDGLSEPNARTVEIDASPSTLRRKINAHFGAVRGPLVLAPQTRYLLFKTVLDRLIALVLLVLTTPLIGLAALLVKLTSPGPALYRQTRVGRKGRLFTILKIRTMVDNCESVTGPRWSFPGDPRVTWVGRLLRLSHLDELPQLVNVLRGEMSLIGPRPERPEFIPNLYKAIPGYEQRLAVRPGVTGLAQVNLPADTSLATVGLKLAYDLYYIRKLSFWMDLRILLCTGLYSLGLPFSATRKLCPVPVEESLRELLPPPLHEGARPSKAKTAA